MKKIFLFLIFVGCTFCLFAKKTDWSVKVNEKTVGINLKNGDSIVAQEVTFPWNIYGLLNIGNDELAFYFYKVNFWQANARLVAFNKNSWSVKWNSKLVLGSKVDFGDFGFLSYTMGFSFLFDVNNGRKKWRREGPIMIVDRKKGIGLNFYYEGYYNLFGGGIVAPVEGVDLFNGQVIWEREILSDYGWNGIGNLNDSTLLVSAAGLHTININDGKGWSFGAKTGCRSYDVILGVKEKYKYIGLKSESFGTPRGVQVVSDIVSNVIVDTSGIFFASKNELVCLDENGIAKWIAALPEKIMSKSIIFLNNENIWLVNYGYAVNNEVNIPFGKPFIASFDSKSGERLYLKMLNPENIVDEAALSYDRLWLALGNRIEIFDMSRGIKIRERLFDEDRCWLGGMIKKRGTVYRFCDTVYEPILLTESSVLFASENGFDVSVFDADLQLRYNVPVKESAFLCGQFGDYKVLKALWGYKIIDGENKIVADINFLGKCLVVDDKLYLFNGNKKLYVVDLSCL